MRRSSYNPGCSHPCCVSVLSIGHRCNRNYCSSFCQREDWTNRLARLPPFAEFDWISQLRRDDMQQNFQQEWERIEQFFNQSNPEIESKTKEEAESESEEEDEDDGLDETINFFNASISEFFSQFEKDRSTMIERARQDIFKMTEHTPSSERGVCLFWKKGLCFDDSCPFPHSF
eukprot:TRINITY_DN2056_c0_g1_i1.p1 TRINITY_DN2056_c0_g1~~TRINITY_DN2056_c0_g1_i1.p1  ORF type:complete len:174 (-),score=28.21 TRINITY_DN2056_c0_g1_i1:95-616(-)